MRRASLAPRKPRAGVRGGVDLLQLPDRDVGVNLCGLQARVPKLFRDTSPSFSTGVTRPEPG